MDLQLHGHRALVTGGSRGIGLAAARALAGEGVNVALVARGLEAAGVAATRITAESGVRAVAFSADTGSDESVRQVVADATDALGGIDILVNAAAKPGGQSVPPTLANLTDAAFHEEINTKVLGYLRCAREVAPQMVDRGWGRIINVSGLALRSTGNVVGSIRNVAVAALTANLAEELSPKGVNVTVVHPGLTRTERTPDVIAARAAAAGISPEEAERQMAANVMIGRLVDASEVANVIAFLASPLSVAVTGDGIAVGGGARGRITY